jgi:hypothetical protein
MPFWLMYETKVVLYEEVKHRSLRTATVTPACSSEAKENDMLESGKLAKISGRDKGMERPKGRIVGFDVGSFVLFRSPRTESTGKFEAKWIGPYFVIEKTRPDAYHLLDPQG